MTNDSSLNCYLPVIKRRKDIVFKFWKCDTFLSLRYICTAMLSKWANAANMTWMVIIWDLQQECFWILEITSCMTSHYCWYVPLLYCMQPFNFVMWLNQDKFCPHTCLLDQSGVTGRLDPYNVHALFVNIDNMRTERFGNYDCSVSHFRRSINKLISFKHHLWMKGF